MGCGSLSTVAVQSWSDPELKEHQQPPLQPDSSGHRPGGVDQSNGGGAGKGSRTLAGQGQAENKLGVKGSSSHSNGALPPPAPTSSSAPKPRPADRVRNSSQQGDWHTALHNVKTPIDVLEEVGYEQLPEGQEGAASASGGAAATAAPGSNDTSKVSETESELELYVSRLILSVTREVMREAGSLRDCAVPPAAPAGGGTDTLSSGCTPHGDAAASGESRHGSDRTASQTDEVAGAAAAAADSIDALDGKEKKAKEAQKKTKKKEGKGPGASTTNNMCLEDYPTALENPFIPQFVFKCVNFIEAEGLRTEGLYRIPGNRSQGELFVRKFNEDPNMEVSDLEIPVNAVATLLKSFFSDLPDALIPTALCGELMEAAEMTDKSSRLIMLRGVIKKLPNQNLEVLKYLITHLHMVAQHQDSNNMNSRNLAKCWWPTLIPLQFKSYEKMVQGSQVPEDIVHTLIEQCPFFFHGGNEV
ncbi:rho GTPase-activating protein 190-like protein [Plakobranchus ocellatus]|uniref:Rho GTPase-activating protein 190-like protein n=1 Tax=Plakobranchus ocellatus TaxID=259542 RepID=A0AAV3ZJW6_9GAST|nr:rho GTPase-activating protein 190-like protein [Plakobranchus ocellatus]